MGESSPDSEVGAAHGNIMRGRSPGPVVGWKVVDQLPDSFPLLRGEPQWLMALLADDLARILADD